MKNILSAAVIGCTGYTGLELIKILYKHPRVKINFLGSRSSEGKKIENFEPKFKKFSLPKINKIKNLDYSLFDIVFLALPSSLSQNIIKKNFGKCNFIDLSADFRFKNPKKYQKNYKIKHWCPELLNNFVYGLAEINKKNILKADNISVPGCYPTSILLPLYPLIRNKFISTKNIIIDSKSGYSGAGKKFNLKKLIKGNNKNFYNYNTNKHRHIDEIYQQFENITNSKINFSFNPHILPVFRGMMSTIYCDLEKNIKKNDIYTFLKRNYKNNKFIKILDSSEEANFFNVNYTNNCLIKLYNHSETNKIIIVSLIDNLIKGASGQAVQCMNLMFGFNEDTALSRRLDV